MYTILQLIMSCELKIFPRISVHGKFSPGKYYHTSSLQVRNEYSGCEGEKASVKSDAI